MSERPATVSRRTVLKSAAGAALAAAVGGPVLTACAASNTDTSEKDAAVKLPTYVPTQGQNPDLPGNSGGVLATWLSYPKSLTPAPAAPGKGGTVTALLPLFTPPPPALPGNRFWSEANKRFGMNWKPTLGPADTYIQKIQTSIAGGDLPDIVLFASNNAPPNAAIPRQPQVLKSLFADLTPYLSGDSVQKYKNLAAIPSPAWVAAVANGGIYGVPITRGQAPAPIYVRRDLFAAAGVKTDPTTLEDFLALCKEINDPRRSRWAIASTDDALSVANAAYGTPNQWTLSGGKLTADIESDEYRQGLEFAVTLRKAGVIFPDVSGVGTPLKQLFGSGRAAIHVDSDSAWPGFLVDNAKTAGFQLGAMVPPKAGANGGRLPTNGSTFGFTAFKKGSKSRIEELLAITDLAASPFGSDTWQFLNFGVIGVDSDQTAQGPMINERGNTELNANLRYLGSAPPTNYIAGNPTQAKARHDYEAKVVPDAVHNPVEGLYSPTLGAKGSALGTFVMNARTDVIVGRKSLASWSDTIKSWRSMGGDAIRNELEKALSTKPTK